MSSSILAMAHANPAGVINFSDHSSQQFYTRLSSEISTHAQPWIQRYTQYRFDPHTAAIGVPRW
jgi:hypothetical protein